jgi:D-alanine-D-alanine ligase
MDKAVMKDVFRAHDLPIVPYLAILRSAWEHDPAAVMAQIETRLGFPCFVKPANLGSSVGVSKASTEKEFFAAVREAFHFDRKVLVEESVPGR